MSAHEQGLRQFSVFGHTEQDPDHSLFRAARDKIQAHEGPHVHILRQLPNAEAPTRLLVQTDARTVYTLLKEFAPCVEIEENRPVFLTI
jgi:hypothetical protein